MRYQVDQSKIKFISMRGHVISSISVNVTHAYLSATKPLKMIPLSENSTQFAIRHWFKTKATYEGYY